MHIPRLLSLSAAAVLAVGLAGCSTTPTSSDSTSSTRGTFPVTVQHAL